ncbi:hypothetical protein VKT23_011325 [Stygiomarasmius scandens]|uniref:Glyoxal oxidase N-terminal domain-containing protein n=1 Tax=Marasmiellus scandens TaxID=2682957 RepID=A0ABR1JCI6_9AGAR
MVLTDAGIAAGWKVETMPQARVMPELILLPDGRILIINGAQIGDHVGSSNADHPAFSPVLYDPNAAAGNRFSATRISSTIAQIYHSTASLTPNGSIIIGEHNF